IITAAALFGAAAARADEPGPVLWSDPKTPAARVYTDGVHAIGGVRQDTLLGQVDVTLLGLRRDRATEYQGKVGGVLHGGRGDQEVTGRWSMDPKSHLVTISAKCAGKNYEKPIRLPDRSDPAPLR